MIKAAKEHVTTMPSEPMQMNDVFPLFTITPMSACHHKIQAQTFQIRRFSAKAINDWMVTLFRLLIHELRLVYIIVLEKYNLYTNRCFFNKFLR